MTKSVAKGKTKRIKYKWLAALIFVSIALFGGSFYIYKTHKTLAKTSTNVDEPLYPIKSTDNQTKKSIAKVNSYTHDVKIPPIINGLAPVISSLDTKEKVVFLGIDDGANKQSFELQLMKNNKIKASLFLSTRFMKDDTDFFKAFIPAGSLIEDHTLDHKLLPNLNEEEQKQEICGEADLFQQIYGRRPILFRPPGGSYDLVTQKVVVECGMKAIVLWDSKANGGAMQYQVGHGLRPGDIVLMHFRPEFSKDMQAFVKAEKSAGLHTELLENWL